MKAREQMGRMMACGGIGALLVVAAGCDKDAAYELRFSHNLHAIENEMDCSDCHGDPEAGRFTLPSHELCAECHDDIIETEDVNEETCGICHTSTDLDVLAATDVPEPVVMAGGAFVHTDALEERCDACHGYLLEEELEHVPSQKRSQRVRLRNEVHRWGLDCTACHLDMDPDNEPPSHDETWARQHGAWGEAPDNACGMCHSEQSCRECHQEMMPDSHNNLWRLKTHGIEAAWDRERCLVCHEPDSCTSCHEEVAPRSHNAAWERNHCYQCHTSASTGTGCALCHESGLDDHPDPHPINWERTHCRTCHSGSPEADQCAACHGPLPLPEHENPHSASFEKNHCTQCHNRPAIDGVGCAECHGSFSLPEHPDPHGAGWESRHCTQCHDGQGQVNGVTCRECHVGVLLDNHPNPHSVSFERTHCTQCHDGEGQVNGITCRECHGGDLAAGHPNPHSSAFEKNHCTQCHESAFGGVGCEVCHGPDILEGHPSPHPPGFERTHCNTCHEGSTVEGIRCEQCHGGDLIGNHPNPHPINFEKSHCYSCHPGSQSASECGPCHEGAGSVLVHDDFWPPFHDRFGEAADCFECHY